MDKVTRILCTSILVSLVAIFLVQETTAMQCPARNALGQVQMLNCPPLFEPKKSYCCGTELNRFCCKKSKAREHNYRTNYNSNNIGGKVAKGIGITLLIILLVVCGCIGLCCYFVCNIFRKRQTNAGSVLGGDGTMLSGQAVHVMNQDGGGYQSGGGYPSQQPQGYPGGQPGYPSAAPGYPPAGNPGYPGGAPSYPGGAPGYPQAPMYPQASYPAAPYPTDPQPPFNPNYPQ